MVTINKTRRKIAVRTHTCVTALDRHSRCTVRCSQRSLYTETNTRYPQCTSTLQVSNMHAVISHIHRLFHSNFGSVPIAPGRPCWVSVSRCLKLFGREIIFEVFQPMWSRYLNVTDGQTTYDLITALCNMYVDRPACRRVRSSVHSRWLVLDL